MRLRVHNAEARHGLLSVLVDAGCSARVLDETLEIVADDAPGAPTELELRFFLRAWQAQHPHVQLLVV